jgi:hypothetical protein
VPCLAENLPYFGKEMDLSLAYNTEEDTMQSIQFKYLSLIAAYMLHALAESQSMGKLLHAFRNVRNMDKFLEENTAPPDGNHPILTRETISYAISLSITCVCFNANDEIVKGRASGAYERALSDLQSMSDPAWHSLLRQLLVTLLTNPEGPAPSAPALTRAEILKPDTARKEANAAAANANANANAEGGGGGGGGGSGDGSSGGGDSDEAGDASGPGEEPEEEAATRPAAAKATKGKGPPAGKKKK